MDRDRDFSASPLREGLSVPVVKQQRAHSQPNIREGLASLNEQLCNTMLGVVLGGGGGSQMRSSSGAAVAATAAARATSVSPSVLSSPRCSGEDPSSGKEIRSDPEAEEGEWRGAKSSGARGTEGGVDGGDGGSHGASHGGGNHGGDGHLPFKAADSDCGGTRNKVCDPATFSEEEVSRSVEQRGFRLTELLESEKVYVKDLEQCVAYVGYMRESKGREEPEIPMPDDLRNGKDRMVFGNIEAIYEWHRDFFLKNLEKSIESPVDLGNLFKKYDRKFQMYVVYCQNKPKSEFIVSEYIDSYFEDIRLKLGFKLRLTDLLIKPIQRLTKYHLLLEEILKYSQRAGLVDEAEAIGKAFHVMTIVPNQANDMMDIGRLQGFEGKITAQGKLLNRGPLLCMDTSTSAANSPPKMKPFTVFLFEQIMIFSEIVGKKTQFTSPVYLYKAHFLVNKMVLEEQSDDGDTLKFIIRSNDPAREELRIVCQAEDARNKAEWVGIMKRQLQTQMDFLRALQAPIAYHNKLPKE